MDTKELSKAMAAFCKLLACQAEGDVLLYGGHVVKCIGFEDGKMAVGNCAANIISRDEKFTVLTKKEEKEED